MTKEEFRIYLIEGSVIDSNDCWLWQGPYTGKGYGETISFLGERYAHRSSFRAFNGPIPKGLIIRHSCDIRPCINPDHILSGTYADNSADCITRGRYIGYKGGRPHEISDKIIQQIKVMSKNYDCAYIARQFGISRSYTWKIVKGIYR